MLKLSIQNCQRRKQEVIQRWSTSVTGCRGDQKRTKSSGTPRRKRGVQSIMKSTTLKEQDYFIAGIPVLPEVCFHQDQERLAAHISNPLRLVGSKMCSGKQVLCIPQRSSTLMFPEALEAGVDLLNLFIAIVATRSYAWQFPTLPSHGTSWQCRKAFRNKIHK